MITPGMKRCLRPRALFRSKPQFSTKPFSPFSVCDDNIGPVRSAAHPQAPWWVRLLEPESSVAVVQHMNDGRVEKEFVPVSAEVRDSNVSMLKSLLYPPNTPRRWRSTRCGA